MVRKKVDERVRNLIELNINRGHRSFFVIIGDRGKDQVPNLHYVLSKCQVKARPSVLWCYKKELEFSSNKRKRMRQIKKLKQRGLYDASRYILLHFRFLLFLISNYIFFFFIFSNLLLLLFFFFFFFFFFFSFTFTCCWFLTMVGRSLGSLAGLH